MSDRPRAAIELRGLTKRYGDMTAGHELTALEDIDLSVAEGEFISIIGPSGCGKTSLLKIMDGLLDYESGQAWVQGRPLDGPGPERAVVFQSFALLPWRTVHGNIAYGLNLRGIKGAKADEIVAQHIQMVGLEGFKDSYPDQLSGGMQQRVGIARALAVDPAILLMDEPFGSLDAQTRNLMQLDLERIWENNGKTVVFVTHAMDEAAFLSDRIAVMSPRPGRIQEVIDVELPRPRDDTTRRDPRFVELTAYIWDVLQKMLVREAV